MEAASRAVVEEELRAALEASGQRFTAQRAAVFNYLRAVTSHPTADEIFTHVREDIPDISLATVYKALEAFVSAGAATKLEFGSGPARYDGRTDEHDHIRCLKCGIVRDAVTTRDADFKPEPNPTGGFKVVGYRLELLGYCPTCRN